MDIYNKLAEFQDLRQKQIRVFVSPWEIVFKITFFGNFWSYDLKNVVATQHL